MSIFKQYTFICHCYWHEQPIFQQLQQQQQPQQRGAPDISFSIDANKQQRQLIAELENKNR